MKRILICIVIGQLAWKSYGKFTCDPYVDCTAADLQVPDIEDCRKYYYCLGPGIYTPSSLPCDEGQYFTSSGECEDAEECEEDWCTDTTPNTCIIECSATNVANIPVPGDCTQYYSCSDPTQTAQKCQDGTYFNGKTCTEDSTECCSVCSYTCYESNTIVADPENCNGYVICKSSGGDVKNNCSEGEYFDVLKKDCVTTDGETCSSYCSYGGGSALSTISQPTTKLTTTTETSTVYISSTTDLTELCYIDFVCPVSFGQFVYCDTCNKQYYDCSSGSAVLTECDKGEVFDYTISSCVPDADCPTFSRNST